jgi:hypothetical protein
MLTALKQQKLLNSLKTYRKEFIADKMDPAPLKSARVKGKKEKR